LEPPERIRQKRNKTLCQKKPLKKLKKEREDGIWLIVWNIAG
jgi:hypothetical protein